jgi:hypothetical protein
VRKYYPQIPGSEIKLTPGEEEGWSRIEIATRRERGDKKE